MIRIANKVNHRGSFIPVASSLVRITVVIGHSDYILHSLQVDIVQSTQNEYVVALLVHLNDAIGGTQCQRGRGRGTNTKVILVISVFPLVFSSFHDVNFIEQFGLVAVSFAQITGNIRGLANAIWAINSRRE